MRYLVPRSRHRQRLLAAWVGLNGGGRDAELRFRVLDQRSAFGVPEEWGCANSMRRIPEGDQMLDTPTGSRLFSSRGIFPAAEGDLPVLTAFCDRLIDQIYPESP